jgi:hypothetical protein
MTDFRLRGSRAENRFALFLDPLILVGAGSERKTAAHFS